jgi:proline utilization trans-activator
VSRACPYLSSLSADGTCGGRCARCRRHKIKCSGKQPCETCSKRGQTCAFNDRERFSQSYVRDLQRRVAAAEQGQGTAATALMSPESYPGRAHVPGQDDGGESDAVEQHSPNEVAAEVVAPPEPARSERASTDSGHRLINNFAMGVPSYLPDIQGKAIYLGTSSTWSFGRLVLLLAQDRIMKAPLSPNELLWEGQTYQLGWNGDRSSDPSSRGGDAVLPQADYGVYLLNTVKFHVGQIFHLFDDTVFMDSFAKFYDPSTVTPAANSLWYSHYLLLLAFGKAFVSKDRKADQQKRPSGCEFFLQAMATLPDLTFVNSSSFDVFEAMEVLCCAALYLHSLDFRGAAYRVIGQALRIALEQGLHTDMENHALGDIKERARRIWFTVLLLDRQMSSLMGLPPALRDEDISAKLPSFGGSVSRVRGLDIHARLSSVLATIVTNVYGKEGRLNSKFLVHTKAALKSVASVTDELNDSFHFPLETPAEGISRVSAYLHLLHHQCVVLATRPIIFTYLGRRLAHEQEPPIETRLPESIWALLQMCKDSALHILRILQLLQVQGLLECFLPFDLDATYTSAMVAQMAAQIDAPLLEDDELWSRVAYDCLDEMANRGNQTAKKIKVELQRLQVIFSYLPRRQSPTVRPQSSGASLGPGPDAMDPNVPRTPHAQDNLIDWLGDSSLLQEGFNGEHMASVADAIDLDGMEWSFLAQLNADVDIGGEV